MGQNVRSSVLGTTSGGVHLSPPGMRRLDPERRQNLFSHRIEIGIVVIGLNISQVLETRLSHRCQTFGGFVQNENSLRIYTL